DDARLMVRTSHLRCMATGSLAYAYSDDDAAVLDDGAGAEVDKVELCPSDPGAAAEDAEDDDDIAAAASDADSDDDKRRRCVRNRSETFGTAEPAVGAVVAEPASPALGAAVRSATLSGALSESLTERLARVAAATRFAAPDADAPADVGRA